MSDEESKKCPICGGWKYFDDVWINTSIGLCLGHEDLTVMVNRDYREEVNEYGGITRTAQDWIPFYQAGSPMPYGWFERHSGEFRDNPDYIAPPGRPEPAQYEQALVDYEQITNEDK